MKIIIEIDGQRYETSDVTVYQLSVHEDQFYMSSVQGKLHPLPQTETDGAATDGRKEA